MKFLSILLLFLSFKTSANTLLNSSTNGSPSCFIILQSILNFDYNSVFKGKQIVLPKQKIFLESSIFNYYFKSITGVLYHYYTLRLFSQIAAKKYLPYSSEYVLTEINRAPEPIRNHLLSLMNKYKVTILPKSKEIEDLANIYLNRIISKNELFDAIHIATATINKIGVLLSLDHSHIARDKTRNGINKINRILKLESLIIQDPFDMIDILLRNRFNQYLNIIKTENIPISIRRAYALKNLIEEETKYISPYEQKIFLEQKIFPMIKEYEIELPTKIQAQNSF